MSVANTPDELREILEAHAGRELMLKTVDGRTIQVQPSQESILQKDLWGDALEAYKSSIFKRVYDGLSRKKSDAVNQIIYDAFKSGGAFDHRRLVEDVMRQGVDQVQADVIVRTERAAVINASRELGFKQRDPNGDFRYGWSVTLDQRTSPVCREIHGLIPSSGLKIDELRMVVNGVSQRHMGSKWGVRDWTPHPNCRSRLVRVQA